MLNLDSHLKITADTAAAANLASEFSEDDRKRIAGYVLEGLEADETSRAEWVRRNDEGLKLSMQISKEKSFPWPNCSNVAFPLVTIAALQFHARAYPALISGSDVVKCKPPYGATPEEKMQCESVSRYMSYQRLETDATWEPDHDKLTLNYAIAGTAFKKTYADGKTPKAILVLAQDLVVDYFAASIEDAKRKTHLYPLSRNDIVAGGRTGKFLKVEDEPWFRGAHSSQLEVPSNERRGDQTEPPTAHSTAEFLAAEQHTWLDLDGDGFEEPYIVTVERNSGALLRIVARWERPEDVLRTADNQIYGFLRVEYFTRYEFIPSPDGSIYGLGFGVLLGPLNESVSTLINQLIDGGTMSIAAGGFLGRGAKIRGGDYSFRPFEWKRVDSTGEDLAKSIYPLPVREPSNVLFSLLGLLIEYTNRISGSVDTMVGENPGQNTPAETSRTMVEMGMKVYNAIYKRHWRCMKEEFKKLYVLNGLYGDEKYRPLFLGDPTRVCPSADPNIASDSEKFFRAQAIAARAASTPGYDPAAVEENYLRALGVDDWQTFYKGFDPSAIPKDPRIQVEEMRHQREMLKIQQSAQEFAATLLEERSLNQAEMIKIQAQVILLLAQAEDARDNREIVRMQTALAALKARDESLRGRVDQLIKLAELESEPERNKPSTGAIHRLVDAPDDGAAQPLAAPPTRAGDGAVGGRELYS